MILPRRRAHTYRSVVSANNMYFQFYGQMEGFTSFRYMSRITECFYASANFQLQ